MAILCGPTPRRCFGLSASGAADGGFGLGSLGNHHEVAQVGGSRPVAAASPAGGARHFSRPVLLMKVGAEIGDVSAITADGPPRLLPRVLVAQGLELRFDVAMMVHILVDHHAPGGSIPLRLRMPLVRVPLQPFHEARFDGQAGLPTVVLWAGHGPRSLLWVRLLMRKLQGLADVGLLLLLMRVQRGLMDVRVLLGTLRWTWALGSGYSLVSSRARSGTLGSSTSAAVERL